MEELGTIRHHLGRPSLLETVVTNPMSNPWLESCNKALVKKVVMYQAVSDSSHPVHGVSL
ncbi:hypothetical protein CIPAW_11G108000 [Carya illinoinensis]|uniref:Uncharacterized protein n=1 Tax=Carya illinoinensis TaxID=32201 RepID=A0A8T1P4R7_CARIL|nr:hypothetical protein CIPAW_11G108000 [Carya illinoinensis]